MLNTLFSCILLTLLAAPDPIVRVEARLDDAAMSANSRHEFVVTLAAADGYDIQQKDMPSPIIQILLPDGVTLEGDEPADVKALSKNHFLRHPFEQKLGANETRIAFKVDAAPAKDARIAFNVIGYAAGKDQVPEFFRIRHELPLQTSARSTAVDASTSLWGRNTELQLGEKAPDFELAHADGSLLKLSDYLGKKEIIITTYRAHW